MRVHVLVCVGKGQSWLFNKIVYVIAVSTVWSHTGYVDKAGEPEDCV